VKSERREIRSGIELVNENAENDDDISFEGRLLLYDTGTVMVTRQDIQCTKIHLTQTTVAHRDNPLELLFDVLSDHHIQYSSIITADSPPARHLHPACLLLAVEGT
jgi:hypothetical protein